MRDFSIYTWRVLKRAVIDTFTHNLLKKVVSWIILSAATVVVYAFAERHLPERRLVDTEAEINLLLLGAIASGFVLLAYFVMNLLLAPARIDRELRKELGAAKHLYVDLKERVRPKLEFNPHLDLRGDRVVLRLRIHNRGALLYGGCDLKMMSMRDRDGRELLPPSAKNRKMYSFGLRGGESNTVDVATITQSGEIYVGPNPLESPNIKGSKTTKSFKLWIDIDIYSVEHEAIRRTFLFWKEGSSYDFWDMGRQLSAEEAKNFSDKDLDQIYEFFIGQTVDERFVSG